MPHLAGKEVVIWGNGKDLGTATGGVVNLPESATNVCVGLPYSATFKSTKLAHVSREMALNSKKNIKKMGFVLRDTHYQGLRFGPDLNTLENLPLTKDWETVSDDTIFDEYDEKDCLLYTSPSPRDGLLSRMPSSA